MGDSDDSEEDVEEAAGPDAGTQPSGANGPRASLRPSRPPHTPHPLLGTWRTARVLFALAWIGLQGTLILTADRRPDGAFGFRMFNEASTMRLSLYREIVRPDGQRERVHVTGGTWEARDGGGMVRRFAWDDRVKRPDLATFDVERHASYGARAEIARLQAAVDDVAAHVPDDAETRRLLLDVTVRQNGREPQTTRLASPERRLPSSVPAGGS